MILYVQDIIGCGQVYREFVLCDEYTDVIHSEMGGWYYATYMVGEVTPEGVYDFGYLGLNIPGMISL
jgi:hypothetical protein